MRLAWAVARFALSVPLWVVGLAVAPFWALERLCYRICSGALFGLLLALEHRQVADQRPIPGTAADLLRKQKLARRHVNYRRQVLP